MTARVNRSTVTPREVEILEMYALGLDGRQIAAALGLSPHTVRQHTHNLEVALGAHTIAGAVGAAYKRGYLSPGLKAAVG